MGFEPTSAELINIQLRAHQTTVEDWPLAAVIKDLHGWAERMIVEFKLEIGVPALMTEPLRGRLGHYRIGRNGFGPNDEIAIDRQHAGQSLYWEVLGSLLHELLHSWQEHHERPPSRGSWNYHNKQFSLDYS